jgi:hypothetical protein
MAKRKRKPTVDSLYDRRFRNDPGPESRDLSTEEATLFEAARKAVEMFGELGKKTFEVWVIIGKAVVAARARADRLGGGKTFRRILDQQGLGKVVSPSDATHLADIMARLPEVEEWRNDLPPKQQIAWASPSAIIKHAKDAAEHPLFPKKRDGTPPRRPPKMNVEVAIDTIVDYCKDLAPDERAAILERVGNVEARMPTIKEATEAFLDYLNEAPDDERREILSDVVEPLGFALVEKPPEPPQSEPPKTKRGKKTIRNLGKAKPGKAAPSAKKPKLQWRKGGTTVLGKERLDYSRFDADQGDYKFIPTHDVLGKPAYRFEPFGRLWEIEDVIDADGNLLEEAIETAQELFDKHG